MTSISNNYNSILILYCIYLKHTHPNQHTNPPNTCNHTYTILHTIGSITLGQSAYGEGIGYISLTHIDCTGTEDNITSCDTDSISTCSHSEDASVICSGMHGHTHTHTYTYTHIYRYMYTHIYTYTLIKNY